MSESVPIAGDVVSERVCNEAIQAYCVNAIKLYKNY
jgi:hypothetical protein